MLRATIGWVCDVRPPTSVTKPVNTPPLAAACPPARCRWPPARARSSLAKSRARTRRQANEARPNAQSAQHVLTDLLEIGLALAQVFVLHLVELARAPRATKAPTLALASPDDPLFGRTGRASSSAASGCTSSSAESPAGASAAGRALSIQLAGDGHVAALRSRAISDSTRLVDGGSATSPTRDDVDHQHGAPDGHAARDRQTDDLEVHGAMLVLPAGGHP